MLQKQIEQVKRSEEKTYKFSDKALSSRNEFLISTLFLFFFIKTRFADRLDTRDLALDNPKEYNILSIYNFISESPVKEVDIIKSDLNLRKIKEKVRCLQDIIKKYQGNINIFDSIELTKNDNCMDRNNYLIRRE